MIAQPTKSTRTKPIHVAALTGGISDSSSRFRIRQLIPGLHSAGIEVADLSSIPGRYPPANGLKARVAWLAAAMKDRAAAVRESRRYDLTILQRELISTLPTFEVLTSRPRVVDVDDAIWLSRFGIAARQLAMLADHVVCGNDYTANFFAGRGASVSIVPTTVDCERYVPAVRPPTKNLLIGWSGGGSGYVFFNAIERSLAALLTSHQNWKLRIVSDKPPRFTHISANQIEYLPWSPAEEVRLIQEMDIGIMPIDDTEWSRGKCSLKMIQYMACGIPVVVSDNGMNTEVLRLGELGYGPVTPDQWTDALSALMNDPERRAAMGGEGRRVAVNHFSMSIAVNHWRDLIERLAR